MLYQCRIPMSKCCNILFCVHIIQDVGKIDVRALYEIAKVMIRRSNIL